MRINAIIRLVCALILFACAIIYPSVITVICGTVGILCVWWFDSPITVEAQVGHINTKEMKAMAGVVVDTVDEPEDSEVVE